MEWLLGPLTEEERSAVLMAAPRRTFTKGQIVFRAGEWGDSVHLVISGHLAVRVSTPDGECATVNVVGAGAHVGELALLAKHAPHQRSATVLALEPSVTRVLTAPAFRDLCAEHPGVEGLLVEMLASRIRELSERLLEAMYVGLDRRLYRTLLRLSEIYEVGSALPVIPLTHAQLADLTGGRKPPVNRILQSLADQGVIELGRGKVVLRDLPALRGKAGPE